MKQKLVFISIMMVFLMVVMSGCGKKDSSEKAAELLGSITRPDSAGYTYLSADVNVSYRNSERDDVSIEVVADRSQMGGVRHLEKCVVDTVKGKDRTTMEFEAWSDGQAVYLKQKGGAWEQMGAGTNADQISCLDFDKAVSFLVGSKLSYGADKAVVTENDMESVIEWDTSWRNVSDIFGGQPDCTDLPDSVHVSVAIGANGKPSKLEIEAGDENSAKVQLLLRIVNWSDAHDELVIPDSVIREFNRPEVSVERPEQLEQAMAHAGVYEKPEDFRNESVASYADKASLSGVPFDEIKLSPEEGYDDMLYRSHGDIGTGGMWFSVMELEQHEDPSGGLDRYNAMCEFNDAWYPGCYTNQYGVPYGWLLCSAWYIADKPGMEYKLDICGVLDDGSVVELQVESYLSDGITLEDLVEKADMLFESIGISTEH